MRILCPYTLLLVSAGVLASSPHCNVKPQNFSAYMKLDFMSFDQSDQKGWRQIAEKHGCDFEGAQIVDAYHLSHAAQLEDWQDRLLYFHAGQSYAFADMALYSVAVARFEKSLNPAESNLPPPHLHWNAYVKATIAFLKKDFAALKASREEFFVGEPSVPDATNLGIVDGFIRCFGKTYRQVYAGEFGCRKLSQR